MFVLISTVFKVVSMRGASGFECICSDLQVSEYEIANLTMFTT
jgi:hypothetical protein